MILSIEGERSPLINNNLHGDLVMNRERIIDILCNMFNDYHNNTKTPAWLIDLHNESDNATLIARLENWRRNYPQQYARHATYVL
jgi:hypothetical protein